MTYVFIVRPGFQSQLISSNQFISSHLWNKTDSFWFWILFRLRLAFIRGVLLHFSQRYGTGICLFFHLFWWFMNYLSGGLFLTEGGVSKKRSKSFPFFSLSTKNHSPSLVHNWFHRLAVLILLIVCFDVGYNPTNCLFSRSSCKHTFEEYPRFWFQWRLTSSAERLCVDFLLLRFCLGW